ncbi:hypothetical protein [Streptomyces sp. NPDC006368]|uniref:hypothetical protein n=1 Tax=Streptomyces sp. NPDC006368 TaxID=3156760 RepID=UPI00339DEAB2
MSERHQDRFEQYGPDGPLHVNDRTGNGIVNNGDGDRNATGDMNGKAVPDGKDGKDGNRKGGSGGKGGPGAFDGFGGDGFEGGGFGGDDAALRRLLQGAVRDLEPSDGALDHLRRAVPARRARKRQALVGMAAAALLFGTAVPAFVHVASSDGASDARPVNAGHGEQTQGGTGEETGGEGGEAGPDGGKGDGEKKPGGSQDGGKGDAEKPEESVSGTSDGTVGGTAAPSSSVPESTPVCEAAGLSVASSQAEGPDAEGKVYGTFRVANVSGGDCVVTADGVVTLQAHGAADPAKITVAEHSVGDAATGLPDPGQETSDPLLLKPSEAYKVQFAWVPSETCPTTGGGSGDPTPDPSTPSSDGGATSTGSDGTAQEGTEPQLKTEDGTPADGSVTVAHTPDAGGPAAETTIPDACAGTVYHTGALPAE